MSEKAVGSSVAYFQMQCFFFFFPMFYRENEIQCTSHYLHAWCQMLFFKECEFLLAYVSMSVEGLISSLVY